MGAFGGLGVAIDRRQICYKVNKTGRYRRGGVSPPLWGFLALIPFDFIGDTNDEFGRKHCAPTYVSNDEFGGKHCAPTHVSNHEIGRKHCAPTFVIQMMNLGASIAPLHMYQYFPDLVLHGFRTVLALELKGCADCTYVDGVIIVVVFGIKQHQQARSNLNIISESELVKRF